MLSEFVLQVCVASTWSTCQVIEKEVCDTCSCEINMSHLKNSTCATLEVLLGCVIDQADSVCLCVYDQHTGTDRNEKVPIGLSFLVQLLILGLNRKCTLDLPDY